MNIFKPTVIIRHKRENLKKCSLRGLEKREDLLFCTYPVRQLPPIDHYILLSVEGSEELSIKDQDRGLLLLDATWKYAAAMEKNLILPSTLIRRRLPANLVTAYPRRQPDCSDPDRGLASIESLFAAYHILERSTAGLLDGYYWKEEFLRKNLNSLNL